MLLRKLIGTTESSSKAADQRRCISSARRFLLSRTMNSTQPKPTSKWPHHRRSGDFRIAQQRFANNSRTRIEIRGSQIRIEIFETEQFRATTVLMNNEESGRDPAGKGNLFSVRSCFHSPGCVHSRRRWQACFVLIVLLRVGLARCFNTVLILLVIHRVEDQITVL